MLTDQELQHLRNLGNEAEAAADTIVGMMADRAVLVAQVEALRSALAKMQLLDTRNRDAILEARLLLATLKAIT